MAIDYLKKAPRTPATGEDDTRRVVAEMLAEIEEGGEEKAREYGVKLDRYSGEILVSRETIDAAARQVPEQLKDDLRFAHEKVAEFARRQRESLQDTVQHEIRSSRRWSRPPSPRSWSAAMG